MSAISPYWQNSGKSEADKQPGRTFQAGDSLICNECCWKDRPCDTPGHFHRDSCPYCLGTGLNASSNPAVPRCDKGVSE